MPKYKKEFYNLMSDPRLPLYDKLLMSKVVDSTAQAKILLDTGCNMKEQEAILNSLRQY